MPAGTKKLTWGLFVSAIPLLLGGLGILLPVLYVYHELSVGFWVGGCLSAFLLLIAIFDFQYGLIFDRLLAPMLLIGSGFRFVFPWGNGHSPELDCYSAPAYYFCCAS